MRETWDGTLIDPVQPNRREVTHVRDAHGVIWRNEGDWWWGNIGHTDEDGRPYEDYRTWHQLLKRGPLTDATGEA